MLTVKDVAALKGVQPETVRRALRRGEFKQALAVGGHGKRKTWLLDEQEIGAWQPRPRGWPRRVKMSSWVVEYAGTDWEYQYPRHAIGFNSREAAVEYMRRSKREWKLKGGKVTGNIRHELSYWFAGSSEPAMVEIISTSPVEIV